MKLIVTIVMLVSSAVSFGIGVSKFFAKKIALFKILITASIGCFMLGKLYELVNLYADGSINEVFNVGMLATVGGLLFLFSASFSQMDGLVDDKSKALIKYRLISLIAPVMVLGIYLPILLSDLDIKIKITTLIIYLFIAQASYYNLKHLIIPDVSFGIIASIRTYSLAALLLELLTALQLLFDRLDNQVLFAVTSILIAISYPCVLIAMDRGSKKWTL